MYQKRGQRKLTFVWLAPLIFANVLKAQTTATSAPIASVDTYSSEQLRAMSNDLITSAAATGAASKTLEKYPGHFTMLAYRSQSGGAEQHEKFADVFVVVDGSAILQSGGTILTPTTSSPGETRGQALEHFSERPLHTGDIVHIPAGTPHLLRVEKGATLLYFVIKVQEVP